MMDTVPAIAKVGFTGSRTGMTGYQKASVESILKCMNVSEAVHGDCIGSDSEFHDICQSMHIPVVLRPGNLRDQRAFCKGAIFTFDPKPPLTRNIDIVNDVDAMIATPKERNEVLRSGTWATIRAAKRQGVPIYIVWPDGSCQYIGKPR